MKKIIIFALAAATLGCADNLDKQLEMERDSLQVEVDNLRVEMDSLILENRKHQFATPDMEKEEIVNAFNKRTDLIPLEPVLGGTMRYGNIEIIDDGLIVASYNDGHVEGSSLFKYTAGDSGVLEFKHIYTIRE